MNTSKNKLLLTALLSVAAMQGFGQVTFNPQATLPKSVLAGAKPVVEKVSKGQINWTTQYIEAKGTGIIDTVRFKNKAQARALAQIAAKADAQRNLLEIVKGVDVTSETTVKELMTESDQINTSVSGTVRGAEMKGDPVEKNGAVYVTLRMPLYADNGLADALTPDAPASGTADNTNPKAPADPAADTQSPVQPGQNGAAAPDAARVGVATSDGTSNQQAGTPASSSNGLKQIALNFINGKPINPQLFPVVYDANGNIVLDTKSLYDPNTGQFPQILKASKDVMNASGFGKAAEVIDVVQNSDGRIVLANSQKNSNWAKAGKIVGTIGKVLLSLM